MAKFLTTSGIANYIEQIIRDADKSIIIVCPYLKVNKNAFDRLKDANRKGIRITVIYGKERLNANEEKKLHEIENLEIFYCQSLHAKCYHNENVMVISSMNLHEFSEKNNREMGILIEATNDEILFKDTLKEIESIKNASTQEKFFKKKPLLNVKLESDKIDPLYNSIETFYIPHLLQLLKENYLNQINKFSFEEIRNLISIPNFPNKGVTLEFGSRLNFKFDNAYDFPKIKYNNDKILHENLPNTLFYWNYKTLSFPNPYIYPEVDKNYYMNRNCADLISNRYFKIIKVVVDKLEFYKTDFQKIKWN
ncbi:MAG: phospholipase D family protein [Bacteroidetes bacterium]|nr:phospholipase D family protein [Bacteroidota bacterium]